MGSPLLGCGKCSSLAVLPIVQTDPLKYPCLHPNMTLTAAVEGAQRAVRRVAYRFTAAAEEALRIVTRVGNCSVPHYSRWGFYPQAAFVVVALIWFEYRPEWATQGPECCDGLSCSVLP